MNRRLPLLLAAALPLLTLLGCWEKPSTPIKPNPSKYPAMVDAFYTGAIAASLGPPDVAEARLTEATRIEPSEPAPWLDLAFIAVNGPDQAKADKLLKTAESKCPPDYPYLVLLKGIFASKQGKSDLALQWLRKAVDLDPHNARAVYLLVQELEKVPGAATDQEILRRVKALLPERPHNLVLLLDLGVYGARAGDNATEKDSLVRLKGESGIWSGEARQLLAELEKSGASGQNLALGLGRLRNLLLPLNSFPRYYQELHGSQAQPVEPLEHFVRLPTPSAAPAPADTATSFSPEPVPGTKWCRAVSIDSRKAPGDPSQPAGPPPTGPVLMCGTSGGLELRLNGAPLTKIAYATPLEPEQALLIDWNDDKKADLLLAGKSGVKLYQQVDAHTWKDVTAQAKLPAEVTGGAYTGAWALDVELDGDLDVLLGSASGTPTVLRNNADGTWTVIHPFPGVSGVRAAVWADLDGDGDNDVALVDGSGKLAVLDNERGGLYRLLKAGRDTDQVAAISLAPVAEATAVNPDSLWQLLVVRKSGDVFQLAFDFQQDTAKVVRGSKVEVGADGRARAFYAELDNNGAVDQVISTSKGSWISLRGSAASSAIQIPEQAISALDLNGDGRLDLSGIGKDGSGVQLINHGSKSYAWHETRPIAASQFENHFTKSSDDADKRINSFGIGGEAELRSALLYEKLPIDSPILHFGLGEQNSGTVMRLTWTNGHAQSEYNLKASDSYLATQRPGGSCPWLFADNGKSIEFVTDVLWSSPLGLRINAQDTAGVAQTGDWVKVRGDQLAARDGFYNLKITAELREADIFDYVRLMTVDHPADTEMVVNGVFSIPPPKLEYHLTQTPKPIAKATAEDGADVTEIVRNRDGRYVDTFGRGPYQGITRDHWVEVELPAEAPKEGPLWLLGYGWVHPTDSSINVAISQGHHDPPRSFSMEVPDGHGGWRTAKKNLGFPAGKTKTMIFDLTGLFPKDFAGPRRVRLRTNLEVYWDTLTWTVPLPNAESKRQVLKPEVADLHYRGISVLEKPDASSPEIPSYNRLETTAQLWRDLTGFYTRFGDVRELLDKVDDRYVLMNGGDEMALKFPAPPPPPAGWVRDFVFISDGWDKDGNLNTSYSTTLLPLPSHDDPAYTRPPVPLQQDPAYKRHPRDWELFHTRWIGVEDFRNALRPPANGLR